MDSGGLTPLLLDAKREYVGQLSDVMAPFVLSELQKLYREAAAENAKRTLYAFQMKLREIPTWNANTVKQHASDVEHRYPFLGDLIAAVFVSYVKILSSIKLHQDKPNIRLKLPSNDSFVHQVFIFSAREFYAAPGGIVGLDRGAQTGVVRGAIETAVREMLPIQDILRAYLGNAVDVDHTMTTVPGDEFSHDAGATAAAVAEAVGVEMPPEFAHLAAQPQEPLNPEPLNPEPQPLNPEPQAPQEPQAPPQQPPAAYADEEKRIALAHAPQQPRRHHDLFSDAEDEF